MNTYLGRAAALGQRMRPTRKRHEHFMETLSDHSHEKYKSALNNKNMNIKKKHILKEQIQNIK